MRRFVLGWKLLGHEKRFGAYIVNYADDLVICCRREAEQVLAVMRRMMSRLKLAVNETKTRVCRLPEEKFDFLGYTLGCYYSAKTGRAYHHGHHSQRCHGYFDVGDVRGAGPIALSELRHSDAQRVLSDGSRRRRAQQRGRDSYRCLKGVRVGSDSTLSDASTSERDRRMGLFQLLTRRTPGFLMGGLALRMEADCRAVSTSSF